MNRQKLKEAEAQFLQLYPGGFQHSEMQAIGKKHKMEQMIAMAQTSFVKKAFSDVTAVTGNMVKMISRSSMVSMFEKPKFRDSVAMMSSKQKEALTAALKTQLHGKSERGFEMMLECLRPYKLAKWPLLTLLPNYYRPDEEVFIKPTTAKGVISHFELGALEYKPQPSWAFYQAYRDTILEMRSLVDPSIAPNNAAFGGFLMMSLPK